jgi:hypothetical protein
LFGPAGRFLEALLAPVIQHQFNRGGKAFETLLAGFALSVGFRHLRAEGDEPFAIPLDHGRVAVSHVRKLNADTRADNGKCRRALFCFLLSALCLRAWGQYSIDWSTIDDGGGTSTGGVYTVTGTIGQPDASQQAMTGGDYSLVGGFWSLIAVQTPGAPLLSIFRTATNTVAVSWPSPSTGWNLQQNANSVSAVTWSDVTGGIQDDGTTKTLIVNPPAGNRFYRLKN